MESDRRPLSGLVSPEAEDLYIRIAAAGNLAIGEGNGRVDPATAAFDELLVAKIVSPAPGEPDCVRVVSQPIALQLLLARRHHQATEMYDSILQGWQSLEGLLQSAVNASQRTADDTFENSNGALEFVADRNTLLNLSNELYLGARKELRSTVCGTYTTPNSVEEIVSPPEPAIASGARFRTLYDSAFASSFAGAEIIRLSVEAGEEARIRDRLPTKLLHTDDRIALVALTETGSAGALLVRSPYLLTLIREWFDATWNDPATTRVGTDSSDEVTPVQRQILRLMASGMTDEAMARSLGTSVRTVRRNVGAIMDTIGVSTRFAAGAAAAKRGWI